MKIKQYYTRSEGLVNKTRNYARLARALETGEVINNDNCRFYRYICEIRVIGCPSVNFFPTKNKWIMVGKSSRVYYGTADDLINFLKENKK